MITLSEAISRHGVDVLDHLDRDSTVPVVSGLARQGDVIVVPSRVAGRVEAATTPVPTNGVAVVRSESGGNTHLLLAEGDVRFDWNDARSATDIVLGTLTVAEGATAYLAHPEHAYVGFAPGTYQVRRQREQADEIRVVAD